MKDPQNYSSVPSQGLPSIQPFLMENELRKNVVIRSGAF